MTIDEAMIFVKRFIGDAPNLMISSTDRCCKTLATEVERLTRDNKNLIVSCERHAELYVTAAQRAETMRADNEVLTASLAQVRAERDGYRNELERGMKS